MSMKLNAVRICGDKYGHCNFCRRNDKAIEVTEITGDRERGCNTAIRLCDQCLKELIFQTTHPAG